MPRRRRPFTFAALSLALATTAAGCQAGRGTVVATYDRKKSHVMVPAPSAGRYVLYDIHRPEPPIISYSVRKGEKIGFDLVSERGTRPTPGAEAHWDDGRVEAFAGMNRLPLQDRNYEWRRQ